jgi:hypothetical protein
LELLSEDGVAVLFIEANGETHRAARLPPACIVPLELKSEPGWLLTVYSGFEREYEILDSVRNLVAVRVALWGDEVSVGLNRFDYVLGRRDV